MTEKIIEFKIVLRTLLTYIIFYYILYYRKSAVMIIYDTVYKQSGVIRFSIHSGHGLLNAQLKTERLHVLSFHVRASKDR